MPAVATIGVYGWTFDRWLRTVREADVQLLLDVRQRRGVRGAEYAWANAKRLQAALDEAGIAYEHHLELAPTAELRRSLFEEDADEGVGIRSRTRLPADYVERYTDEILDRADLAALAAGLPAGGSAALFCVEADPEACHRSLIAERLADRHGFAVRHLRPA